MIAKREIWNYHPSGKVWVGKYRNSHNLLHWHSDCEFLYVENGSIDVFCSGKSYALTVEDSLFIDSGQMHYMRARTPDTVLIVIVFDYSVIQTYFSRISLACPKLTHKYPIPAVYARLRQELLKKKPFFGAAVAAELFSLMLSVFRGEPLTQRGETKSVQSLRTLLEQINEQYEYITFADAAKIMCMSPSYFSRYFHEMTGTGFAQYLNYVKTDNAIRLLQSDDPPSMTDISLQCGFGTIRSFNRVFKELTGFSPRDLPKNYIFDERFSYPSEKVFNPNLLDCVLIESSERENEK